MCSSFFKCHYTIYGAGRKPLWACREMCNENSRDTCIQVKKNIGAEQPTHQRSERKDED
jgi:hypothetical protein